MLAEVIGSNLRRLRLERGLSQDELGVILGLHRSRVGVIEAGAANLALRTWERMADRLGVTPLDLLGPELGHPDRMVEVWVEPDGDGWRWGVDRQERGRIVRTADGFAPAEDPDPAAGGVRPGYEVTALLMVRQGLTRYDPANPPTPRPMDPRPEPEPARPSPTLAERAKRGRQGSL